jgi:hypothetical protein
MRWTLVLERVTENCLNPDIMRRHLKAIAAAAERNKGLGFTSRLGKLGEPEEVLDDQGRPRKRYLVRLRLSEQKARSPEVAEERFGHVLDVLKKAAGAKERGEWKVVSVKKGDKAQMPEGKKGPPADGLFFGPRPPFNPPDLMDEVMQASLAGIYERNAPIRVLNDAVQTLLATNGEIRAHTILYGLPGGYIPAHASLRWFVDNFVRHVLRPRGARDLFQPPGRKVRPPDDKIISA